MIRNAVIHLLNEQPVLADLYEMPQPRDQGLLCTNLRTMDGKRPVFIERMDGVFFFPYLHIRFVEIPPGAISGSDPLMAMELAGAALGSPLSVVEPEPELDLEIDDDFLRRVREA